jgi:formate hydrogenlyase subunit 6/NADH:ubiquinone oxidoreductase subunit I
MSAPQTYNGSFVDTVKSFWHGLSITLSFLFRRPTTVQYPDRTPLPVRETLPPRYRGFLEVDVSICTGCQACERACPIACMQITLEKDPANPKQRVVTQFDIDEAKCMFCGLCVEPCPTGAIQHTREFEGSMSDIRNLTIRWADPLAPFPVWFQGATTSRAPSSARGAGQVQRPPLERPGPSSSAGAAGRRGRPGRRRSHCARPLPPPRDRRRSRRFWYLGRRAIARRPPVRGPHTRA